MIRAFAALIVLALGWLACSTSCPAEASSCSDGCTPILGQRVDADASCWHQAAIVGCHEDDEITADSRCSVRVSDGALVSFPSSQFKVGAWRACNADEQRAVFNARGLCP